MSKRWIVIGTVCALVVALVSNSPALQAKKTGTEDDLYKQLELFTDALSIVQSDYVEEPKPKELVYGALKGMLATLDPYSQFLDPDSYNELKIDTEGQFGGLGVEITIKDDLLTVITPVDDTPAYKAGLKAGDHIVKINGESTRGITLLDAVKKLRGKPQTPVTLTVLREGEQELKELTITRDIIKIQSVKDVKIIEAHIGYIRISDFRENTPKDLENAIDKLKQQQMDSVIIDLRNDPGGLLDVAVTTTELFLNRQQLIVSTKGRIKSQNLEFRSRRQGMVSDLPLVVLVNEGSASASEIFAGAIQDYKRGVILGTKSHGKASVQTIFPLKDGSALRLTTSKYFTPAGRLIHGQGIIPDVVVKYEPPVEAKEKSKSAQAEEIFDTVERSTNEKDKKDESKTAGTKSPTEKDNKEKIDNQLARAVDLLKGIKVFQASLKANAGT